MVNILIIGAGATGKGFLPWCLPSDAKVTFVDGSQTLIDELRKEKVYSGGLGFLDTKAGCDLSLLSSLPANVAVDCYTRAPVYKPTLLAEMLRQFGLRFEIAEAPATVNATGLKPRYYSLNKRAADFGYIPTRTSMEGILEEARVILVNGIGS